jgi:NAD(P)-dependent dehydrogenase (short-subunit alcohol dehydrogenase family)
MTLKSDYGLREYLETRALPGATPARSEVMPANLFDLSGRVALVTGASRGIGAAIAATLAAYGAQVIVSSRRREACEEVVAKITAAGGRAEALACHIGETESICEAFRAIDASHGRIDILVNNAATNPYFGPALDMDLASFQKTMDVNVRGYFWASMEAGRRMRAQGRGAIVNVASVNGVRPMDGQLVYSMTKAAIINMTQGLARECGRQGIRVNALLPGITETKFATALHGNPAIRGMVEKMLPLGRIAQPEEMTGAVLYLVSDASSYTTGTCLTVDGGWLA